MKKPIIAILFVCLTVMPISSCGISSSDNQKANEATEELEEEHQTAKELSHEFDSETNQHESFYELQFEVPISWQKSASNDGADIVYYYPENGILMFNRTSGNLDFTDEKGFDNYIESLKSDFDDFNEIDRFTTTVMNDLPALDVTFTGTISETPITAYNIVFSTENNTYSVVYADYDISSYDRSKDFEEIIKSIDYTEITSNLENGNIDQSTSEPSATTEQRNALSSARDYLDTMAFSYSGLIEQLQYEGYSAEAATYAADNCGADWNAQAAEMAQSYLDTMSFSRQGLIDQLIYEGFSQEQAEYGVSAVGY